MVQPDFGRIAVRVLEYDIMKVFFFFLNFDGAMRSVKYDIQLQV